MLMKGLDFTSTAKQDAEVDSALQMTRKRIHEAQKMSALLHREKTRNETLLEPLRVNAKKLSFLHESTKANDGIPPMKRLMKSCH